MAHACNHVVFERCFAELNTKVTEQFCDPQDDPIWLQAVQLFQLLETSAQKVLIKSDAQSGSCGIILDEKQTFDDILIALAIMYLCGALESFRRCLGNNLLDPSEKISAPKPGGSIPAEKVQATVKSVGERRSELRSSLEQMKKALAAETASSRSLEKRLASVTKENQSLKACINAKNEQLSTFCKVYAAKIAQLKRLISRSRFDISCLLNLVAQPNSFDCEFLRKKMDEVEKYRDCREAELLFVLEQMRCSGSDFSVSSELLIQMSIV